MPREKSRIFRVRGFEEIGVDPRHFDNIPIIITGSYDCPPPYTKQRYLGMTRRERTLMKERVNYLQKYIEAAKGVGRRVHYASEEIEYADFKEFLKRTRVVEIVGNFSEDCVVLAIEEIVRRRKVAIVNPRYTIPAASGLPEFHRGRVIINALLTENPNFNCYVCGEDLAFSRS